MRRILKGFLAAGFLAMAAPSFATTSWSAADYDLYPGDFDGDGVTDLLYISKNPANPSGIVLSDGTQLSRTLQTWGNAYLGIPWSDNQYNVIVADFDGDGKSDILLQRKTPGDSYLLLTEADGVGAISQTIPYSAAGLLWTADQHKILAGDFDGDGKADLFFQAVDTKGLNAIVLSDAQGMFTATTPKESWADGYAGYNWATSEANVIVGDFNGDGRADLLIQAQPVQGGSGGQPAVYLPNSYGVILSLPGALPFSVAGVQAWNQDGFGARWTPLTERVVAGDFNGDGVTDVLLQGLTGSDTSYLLLGRKQGAVFSQATVLASTAAPPASDFKLLPGRYVAGKTQQMFGQATSSAGSNFLATLGNTGIKVVGGDLPAPASASLQGSSLKLTPATNATIGSLGAAAPAAILATTSAGRTTGSFAVSPMGTATYAIPVWSPPGARGIQPALSLNYSSGTPDGNMGPGWSLGGLSAISRCAKTYAENAQSPAQVTLTSTDDFCIDGNRLRVTSGTYGANLSVYQTELANFSRITAYGTAGNGPSYFIVEGKDGLLYEYGNTADSKAYATGGSTPYAWMLNKVRDRQAQADNMVIAYSTTSGAIAPTSIQYTQTPSTNGTTYPYAVVFSYQNRVVPASRYVAAQNIFLGQILSKIDVQSAGVSVRQYNLTYSTTPTTQRDRLSSVQECGGSVGTDCLRPSSFGYQDGAQGVASASATAISEAATVLAVRDFDGDGRTDILYTAGGVTKIVLANASGYSAPYTLGTGLKYVTWGDLVSSGHADVLAVSGTVWTRYYWNGSGFSSAATTLAAPAICSLACQNSRRAALQDIDGDGRPDLLFFQVTSSTSTLISYAVTAYMNSSAGGVLSLAAAPITVNSGAQTCNATLLQICSPSVDFGAGLQSQNGVVDFNGDGRADFVLTYATTDSSDNTTYDTYLMNAWGSPTSYGVLQHITGTLTNVSPFTFFGNLNRDNCTDVANSVTAFYSACSGGTFQRAPSIPGLGGAIGLLDWDGDGQADILFTEGTSVYVALSTSAGWATPTATTIPQGTIIFIDQNGDGLPDVATVGPTSTTYRLHAGANTPADLLTSITDGWGLVTGVAYSPITQSNYTKGTGAAYPELDVVLPLYVVGTAALPDGIGGTYTNTFSYTGARMNLQGRGLEGFSRTRSTDSRNGIVGDVYFNQAWPYTGTVSERDTYQPNGTSLIAKVVNHFSVTDLAAQGCTLTTMSASSRCFPWIDTATQTSYEIATGSPLVQTNVAAMTYDTYGNPLTTTSTKTDNDPTSPNYNNVWTSVVTNTYGSQNVTTWCLDKPTHTTTANTISGQSTSTRTVDHSVDTGFCRNTTEVLEPGDTRLQATTTFGFDSCGNVNSVSVVGLDQNGAAMATRTTGSSFGVRCTFPESVTNALSQTAYAAYNYSFGTKASTTDPNGIAVTWLYDNFGRRTKETRPDGTYTTWQYDDCVAVTCWGVTDNLRLRVSETRYDSASGFITAAYHYVDGFERGRYDAAYRVLGVLTWSRTNWDALGRSVDTYLPYSSTSNGYHHLQYDLLNRPVTDQLYNNVGAIDRTTSMAYAGLKSTFTDARSNATTKWADVTGKLRRIVDPSPGGTTNYTFDPFGNLTKIVDAMSATTVFTYNIRGFKTSAVDPDAGTTTFTPDSLNELVTQVDASANQTDVGYDLLGRIISRTERKESLTPIVWKFGTSAANHNIGKLQSVSKPDGYAESYTFDAIGRPATTSITEDAAYSITYAYNNQGSVDTVTYPASTGTPFALKYLYSYGATQQVKDNSAGTVFWSIGATNDSSLPTSEVLGNGVTVTSTYEPWTNAIQTRQEGTGGVSNNLQDLTYQWDAAGNLYKRQDNKQGLTEIFVSDPLNRLSSSTLNGNSNLSVGYDAAGNISSKSDVGSYDYSTAQIGCTYQGYTQPHAVRKAGTAVFCYDANGNVTNRGGGAITWTSYNLPSSIVYGGNSTTFNYNASHKRWKQDANYGGTHEVTYYIGGLMEKVTKGSGPTEYRHMIPGGSNGVILTRRSDSTTSTYYATSDHLGSSDLVMDSVGNVMAKESFTPFGARRGSNWQGIPTTADYTAFANTTRRGFTHHEMLDSVSLVHMNGRVYEPTVGRFLSVDPLIQTIQASQALDPYSYVMNRPLAFTDPSGFSWLSKLGHALSPFEWVHVLPLLPMDVQWYYGFQFNDHVIEMYPAVGTIEVAAVCVVSSIYSQPEICAAASAHLARIRGGNLQSILVAAVVGYVGASYGAGSGGSPGAPAVPVDTAVPGAVVGNAGEDGLEEVIVQGGATSYGKQIAAGAIGSAVPSNAPSDVKGSGGPGRSGVPAHFKIISAENQGNLEEYKYQLTDADGNAITGPGYSAAEYISPADTTINANGRFVSLPRGVFTDEVGWWSNQVPPLQANIITTQSFVVLYRGVYYPISTVFQHWNLVIGSEVVNAVTVVTP